MNTLILASSIPPAVKVILIVAVVLFILAVILVCYSVAKGMEAAEKLRSEYEDDYAAYENAHPTPPPAKQEPESHGRE